MPDTMQISVLFEPIIDSHNPPIGVDSVLLGESSTGSIRVNCFSGNAYVEREEPVRGQSGEEVIRKWIRPVIVLDVGYGAVNYIEGYFLYRLSQNREELKRVLSQNQQLSSILKHELGVIEGDSINADNANP